MDKGQIDLEDVIFGIKQNIMSLENLEGAKEVHVKRVDAKLTKFLNQINAKWALTEGSQTEQLNALFSMLNKTGQKKAKKLNLIYSPPKIIIRKTAKKVKFKIMSADGTTTKPRQPEQTQTGKTAIASERIKSVLRVAPKEETVYATRTLVTLSNQPADRMTVVVATMESKKNVTFHRRMNPDGSVGGFVEQGNEKLVSKDAYLGPQVVIFNGAIVGDRAQLDGRVLVNESRIYGDAQIKAVGTGAIFLEPGVRVSDNASIFVVADSKLTILGDTRIENDGQVHLNKPGVFGTVNWKKADLTISNEYEFENKIQYSEQLYKEIELYADQIENLNKR